MKELLLVYYLRKAINLILIFCDKWAPMIYRLDLKHRKLDYVCFANKLIF